MWLICVHGGSHKQTMLTLNPKDLLNQLPRHCISPNEAMKSQLETVWCFLLRLSMIINLYIYIIYNYKWLFLTIPSLPSFSHPQGHWQFHRTKCDLNWPFDNFSLWVRNINLHIASWAQCHSWHGLPSWNYLLLCASRLSQLKEIKLKIDWKNDRNANELNELYKHEYQVSGKPPESETQSKISMCTRSKANW